MPNQNKKNITAIIASIAVAFIILLLILNPERYINSVRNGVSLFAVSVLPALFPFFFFTKILSSLGSIKFLTDKLQKPVKYVFNMPPEFSFIFFMSLLSGYPVGAKLVSEHYGGNINHKNITEISAICSTSGPLFMIGTVGFTLLGNKTAGIIIFLSHILAVILFALTYGFISKKLDRKENKKYVQQNNKTKITHTNTKKDAKNSIILKKLAVVNSSTNIKTNSNLLGDSIESSVLSIMTVGGLISIFYMIIDILGDFFVLSFAENIISYVLNFLSAPVSIAKGISAGLVEITRGCSLISVADATLRYKTAAACFVVTTSGACIAAQSYAFLGKCNIKFFRFLLYKLLQAVIAVAICFTIFPLFN